MTGGVYAETGHQAAAPVPDARAHSLGRQVFNSFFLQSPSITAPKTAFPPRAAILQHTNHSSHCVRSAVLHPARVLMGLHAFSTAKRELILQDLRQQRTTCLTNSSFVFHFKYFINIVRKEVYTIPSLIILRALS